MKRYFCLIMMVMMLVGVACGEETKPEINLDNMTLTEIKELYLQVSSALYTEVLIKGTVIPLGNYTIGTDLPEGSYIITFEWDEYDQYGDGRHEVRVRDESGNTDYDRTEYLSYPKNQFKVSVSNGEILEISTEVRRHSVTARIQLLIPFMLGN